MQKVIHKYKLYKTKQELELPIGSEFLSVNAEFTPDQFNPSSVEEIIFIYFLVPTDEQIMKVKRTIIMLGTGDTFEHNQMKYLKTIRFKSNNVYHFFESQ
jgi:hypothetical protein